MFNHRSIHLVYPVFVFGLVLAGVATAAPIGTGFSYQGRLTDANEPADGLYDLQFKLYDANTAGTQKGATIDVTDLDVTDGYFRVILDFGSGVFDGNDRWLEIGVRPGELNDPNVYEALSPRQEIMPTPYALHTYGLSVVGNNTFVGKDAGASNTTGYENTFIGDRAGFCNTTGYDNTFSGDLTGYPNTTGYYNTFSGARAGSANTEGKSNTFSGAWAGFHNTLGNNNTFSGAWSGYFNTTSYENTFLGYKAGYSNTTGETNTFSGAWAGFRNTTGYGNVFIGYKAGYNETGSNKLYIANSEANPPLIYGDFGNGNVGIGTTTPHQSLEVNGRLMVNGSGGLDSHDRVKIAFYSNLGHALGSEEFHNTYGPDASYPNCVGHKLYVKGNELAAQIGYGGWGAPANRLDSYFAGNVGIGTNAPQTKLDVAGHINSSESYQLRGATVLANYGFHNVFVGQEAGRSNSGWFNTFVGDSAGYNNTGSMEMSGTGNTFLGDFAGYSNTSGSENTCLGDSAGYDNKTGSGNVFIGAFAGAGETGSNKLYIGCRMLGPGLPASGIPLIYGDFETGKVGIGTASPEYKLQVDGDVCPKTHKGSDLGKSGLAWDDIHCNNLHYQGAAAFTDRTVTDEILQHPPMAKKPGMFDYVTEKGLEELNPDSLPQDLHDDFDLLADEMTTYNYKANYEQQVQIKNLQEENETLRKRVAALESAEVESRSLARRLEALEKIVQQQTAIAKKAQE